MFTRPPFRPFMAIPKPVPSSPSRLPTGIRTFSMTTWRVGWAFQPIFVSSAPKDRPGVPSGTMNAVIPALPVSAVRAITRYTPEDPAPEMNCLVPLST